MRNKPRIRFKGFTEDWEQRKFKDLFIERREKTIRENEETLLSCAITGIYLNSELFSHFRGSSTIGYLKIKKYDLILSAQNLHLGNANINLSFEKGMISPAYKVFELKNIDPYFINAWVKKDSTKNFFLKATTEGASQCRKNIEWDVLLNQEIPVPNNLEQRVIGKFINNIDMIITLHQRKIEKLKLAKKALLQKLFPKNGSQFPEIRFKGFTDAWEQRKFGELFILKSGVAFKLSEYTKTGIPIINGESIKAGKISLDKVNYLPNEYQYKYQDCLLFPGDIVLGLNRPIIDGELKISRIPSDIKTSLLYQRAGKIIFKVNVEETFTYQLLSKEVLTFTRREAVGSDQPFITTTKLNKWDLCLPVKDEERRMIGNLLDNINNIITLHQRKLDKLQDVKKGLLQKIFV